MKTIYPFVLLLILACLGSHQANAQEIRLNGYTGYVFDDSFDNYYSSNSYMRGRINGGLQWGVGFEYLPSPYYGVEFLYYRQNTTAPVEYWQQGDRDRVVDLGINYVLLDGKRYFNAGERFEGFGGLVVGAVIYSNKDPRVGEPNTTTKLALGARLGGNLWATERIGIMVQTQFLSAIQGFGGNFYLGTGGSGAGVSTYSTIFQFGLGGGLTLRLGR